MLQEKVDDIIQEAKTYIADPKLKEKIQAAFEFAEKAHAGQMRLSGEPYITHPVAVTRHLMSLHPDLVTIQAAFLHDVPEDTAVTVKEIEKAFGPTVAQLTEGMKKLGRIKFRGEERAIENLKKMFLAMSKDVRVILIKLCDRLHNMETLHFHPNPEKVIRIAQETLNIYAPIAARLGIYQIKDRLEDLSFKTLYPFEYENIVKQLDEKNASRARFITTAKKQLKNILSKQGVEAEIVGRVKSPYSIFKKLNQKHKTQLDDLYDIFAVRVLVQDKGACYAALGIIHEYCTPVPQRFKDYIAVPKVNNYQSLHTTVIGLGKGVHDQPTEIQIRTHQMNAQAEFGIAAHFLYKEKGSRQNPEAMDWMKSLAQVTEQYTDHSDFLDSLKMDFFSDRIFVLTPKGDVKDLPVGSTPIDFAYSIHTAIGHRCKGAKVDGSIVPLNYQLQSGEVVEILTRTELQPNQYWLSFVKSNEARGKIRTWFLTQNREDNIKLGRELLNKQLHRLGHSALDPDLSVLAKMEAKHLNLKEREQILEMIGNGSVTPVSVIRRIFPSEEPAEKKEEIVKEEAMPAANPQVVITGERNVIYRLSACCKPLPPNQIIGYVTRSGSISIHRRNCRMLSALKRERLLESHWLGEKKPVPLRASIFITAADRVGVLKEILEIVYRLQINIHNIATPDHDPAQQTTKVILDVEISNYEELDRLISTLEVLDSIVDIEGKVIK